MREAHETAQTLYQVKHGMLPEYSENNQIAYAKNGCCVSPIEITTHPPKQGRRLLQKSSCVAFTLTYALCYLFPSGTRWRK